MADRSLFWYFVILLAIFSEINGFPLCPKSTSLLPCIVGMTKVMNFRLHIDIIRFFDEYITGRAKIIRKNNLTHQETLLLNEQMTRNLHVRFLKGIYYSLHMYVLANVALLPAARDRGIQSMSEPVNVFVLQPAQCSTDNFNFKKG